MALLPIIWTNDDLLEIACHSILIVLCMNNNQSNNGIAFVNQMKSGYMECYHRASNIRRNKSPNMIFFRLVMQLSLLNQSIEVRC